MVTFSRFFLVAILLAMATPAMAADRIITRDLETIIVPKELPDSSVSASPAPTIRPTEQILGTVPATKLDTPPSMWSHKDGADYNVLRPLIEALPVHTASATGYKLKALLLASLSSFPGKQHELAPLQLQMLTSMGEESVRVAASSPEATDKARIEQLLLQGDNKAACVKSAAAPTGYSGTFWQQLAIFCQVEHKDYAKAKLAMALMSENKETLPPYFEPLVNQITGDSDIPLAQAVILPQNPLHFALLTKARINFTRTVGQLTPAMQRTIALSPAQMPEQFLTAGEAALRAGTISADDLAALYKKTSFTKQELTAFTPTTNPYEATPKGRALLYQYTLAQKEPDAAIAEAIHAFDKNGMKDSANALFLQNAINYTHGSVPSTLSNEMLAILIVGKQLAPVEKWLSTASASKQRKTMIGLLLAIATPRNQPSFEDYDTSNPAFTERLALLMQALNYTIPDTLWKQLTQVPFASRTVSSNQSTMRLLQQAGQQQRKGALILATLLALGEYRPSEIDSTQIAAIVKQLNDNGFKNEARSLAVEALLN